MTKWRKSYFGSDAKQSTTGNQTGLECLVTKAHLVEAVRQVFIGLMGEGMQQTRDNQIWDSQRANPTRDTVIGR